MRRRPSRRPGHRATVASYRDDVAIVRLARPLTGGPLVAVAQAPPPTTNLTILGGGLTTVKAGLTGDGRGAFGVRS